MIGVPWRNEDFTNPPPRPDGRIMGVPSRAHQNT
ncbi:hypothetical protein TNCT_707191, partial [Trichonephila clavata]